MRVLIVEDEGLAADRLGQMIRELQPGAQIAGRADSVKSAVRWFQSEPAPDLAFFDIQLADGLSFEIFEKVHVSCPIIFTTAYDQYAIQAFKVNSIDYLLKPIKKDDLKAALAKFQSLKAPQALDVAALAQLLRGSSTTHKERFVIKVGEHLKAVPTQEIQVFYSQDKATYALTNAGQRHLLDFPLDQIEGMVDPTIFFRINRKFLLRFEAVKDMVSFTNSRLKLSLHHFQTEEAIVAREKVQDFKAWLEKGA